MVLPLFSGGSSRLLIGFLRIVRSGSFGSRLAAIPQQIAGLDVNTDRGQCFQHKMPLSAFFTNGHSSELNHDVMRDRKCRLRDFWS